jgi:hypothetical protein
MKLGGRAFAHHKKNTQIKHKKGYIEILKRI